MSTQPLPSDSDRFWAPVPPLDVLAHEQGVEPVADLKEIFGAGADLWASDEEFESFLAGIYRRRHEEAGGQDEDSTRSRRA